MPHLSARSIERALSNIERHSDTDVFPRAHDYDSLFSRTQNRESIIEYITQITSGSQSFTNALNDTPPINQSTIYPAGYNGYRWVTKIDPLWNLIYLSMAVSIAEAAEPTRPSASDEIVFSHRLTRDPDNPSDLFQSGSWGEYIDASVEKSRNHKFVVQLDLADFYSRIYLHRVENEAKYAMKDSPIPSMLNKMLMVFNDGRSFGIPVGGPASRIISELVLNATDLTLNHHTDIPFMRYADDYRLFVDSEDEANRHIAFISELMFRNEGLSLQKSKTRIIRSSDFRASVDFSGASKGSAEHLLGLTLHYDPYSPTAEQDYETLKTSLADFNLLELLSAELQKGRADLFVISKLIRALTRMPNDTQIRACITMLENTRILHPVLPKMLHLTQIAARNAVDSSNQDGLKQLMERVREASVEDHYISASEINTCFVARILEHCDERENERLLGSFFLKPFGAAHNPSALVRSEVIRIFGEWNRHYWLRSTRTQFGTLHPRNQEEFYRASYALGDEGRHWRQSNKRTINEGRLPFLEA